MTVFRFGNYRLDPATRELADGGAPVALPPRVFDGLLFLIERRERAVSRDELIEAMWGARGATDVQLAQLVLQCRRAVGDDGQAQRAIKTVPGFGYRWVAPVQQGEAPVAAPSEAQPAVAELPRARAASSRKPVAFALAAVAALAAAAFAWQRFAPKPAPDVARVLVAPVGVDDADARWLRLGGMDVVVDRLRQNGVPVLSSEATVALLQGLDGRAGESEAPSFARRAREDGGADATVAIAASHAADGWTMTATLARGGETLRRERARADDAIDALRMLADRLSGALGHAVAEPGVAVASPALAATLQKARAALLANETDRARELLEADRELVANEPLLRQQLAEVDIRAGRYADARAKLDALLATDAGDARFRAQLLNARGTVSIRNGRFADAGRDFSSSLDLLGERGDVVAVGRAHLGRATSRTSLQDYAGAQDDYAKAREAFARAGDLGSIARVDTNQGALEILRGHPAQAEPYLARARERFRDFGFVQEEINVLQLTFVARRMRLDNDAAAEAIEAAWGQRGRIVSPSSRLSVGLYRVESLLERGRLAEARGLLDALPATARAAADAEGERLQLTRAALLRGEGKLEDALAALAPVSDAPQASADDDMVRAGVGLLRARLERALGRSDGAERVPAADAIAPATPRTPLRLLADANRAWARGDAASAERAFASALGLADEQGVADTLVAVASDYAEFLLAERRAAEAGEVAARLALWAEADFDAALTELRVAHAAGPRVAWSAALERARRLAGERPIAAELTQAPE